MVISLVNKKRGWIRILEAVIAILLLSGVLVYVVVKNEADAKNKFLEKIVTNLEINILEGVSSDENLRNATLNRNYTLLQSFVSASLADPNFNGGYFFNYSLGICDVNAPICSPESPYLGSQITTMNDVYVQERIISSTLTNYDPKNLRVFIWVSE